MREIVYFFTASVAGASRPCAPSWPGRPWHNARRERDAPATAGGTPAVQTSHRTAFSIAPSIRSRDRSTCRRCSVAACRQSASSNPARLARITFRPFDVSWAREFSASCRVFSLKRQSRAHFRRQQRAVGRQRHVNASHAAMIEHLPKIGRHQRLTSGKGYKGNKLFPHLVNQVELFLCRQLVAVGLRMRVLVAMPTAQIARLRDVPIAGADES